MEVALISSLGAGCYDCPVMRAEACTTLHLNARAQRSLNDRFHCLTSKHGNSQPQPKTQKTSELGSSKKKKQSSCVSQNSLKKLSMKNDLRALQ